MSGFLDYEESGLTDDYPRDILDWLQVGEIDDEQQLNVTETNGLGSLDKELYMLIPSGFKIDIRDVMDIGICLTIYKDSMIIMAGIYYLAKKQALKQSWSEDVARKWAFVRLQAFSTGWFDNQTYTRFEELQENPMPLFLEDIKDIIQDLQIANNLAAFVPFLNELNFRTHGTGFSKANESEYLQKAEMFANYSYLGHVLNYFDADKLYGSCLLWIGVKRPMLALQNEAAQSRIPDVFKVRKRSPTAGLALITNSNAVIKRLGADPFLCASILDNVKEAAGYDDSVVRKVSEKIYDDPWKYHRMHGIYGVEGPTDAEKEEIEEAKKKAIMFAPYLQACCDLLFTGTDASRLKVLKKYAVRNLVSHQNACRMVRQLKRDKIKVFEERFSDIFGKLKRMAGTG